MGACVANWSVGWPPSSAGWSCAMLSFICRSVGHFVVVAAAVAAALHLCHSGRAFGRSGGLCCRVGRFVGRSFCCCWCCCWSGSAYTRVAILAKWAIWFGHGAPRRGQASQPPPCWAPSYLNPSHHDTRVWWVQGPPILSGGGILVRCFGLPFIVRYYLEISRIFPAPNTRRHLAIYRHISLTPLVANILR